LFGAAEGIAAARAAPIYPRDRPVRDRVLATLTAALDPAQLTAAREAGRALGLDEAMAEAQTVAEAARTATFEDERIDVHEPIRLGYEQAVAAVRAALGDEPFRAAWDAGRSLPLAAAVGMAADLRAEPGAAPDRSAAPEPSSRLSARELEVLRLVAAGHTDREIAAALAISRRTATTHLTHILDKLGLDSRAAAAAEAVRRGLV
jgi:DNA-binding CsgD family transcriptional regulator